MLNVGMINRNANLKGSDTILCKSLKNFSLKLCKTKHLSCAFTI